MKARQIVGAALAAVLSVGGGGLGQAQGSAVTPYGSRSAAAPADLDLFAFLVGKWQGTARVRLANGTYAGGKVVWIGRWVLDGDAIADEFHASNPDGSPYLGLSLRRYDPAAHAWTIEYVNVTGNFLRRQVNPRSGSVAREGDTVTVTAVDGDDLARETYRLQGHDHFLYAIATSKDRGRSWDAGSLEITLERVE